MKHDDARALQELAALVEAGRPVPADLQTRANAAIARAVEQWKMPPRPAGRPRSPGVSPKVRRIALRMAALQQAGIAKAEAKEIVADELGIADSNSIYRPAKLGEAEALDLLQAAAPGEDRLDRIAPADVADEVREAERLATWASFDVLPQRGNG